MPILYRLSLVYKMLLLPHHYDKVIVKLYELAQVYHQQVKL